MNIDWNGDLEVKVWDKQKHPTNGWTDVVKIEKSGGCYWVYYVGADGELYFWSATQSDGTMYAGKPFGQVRNKKKTNPIAKVSHSINHIWYIENPKPSNLATFYFDKQGDIYTLTGWKNVMSSEEIEHKYGVDVRKKYWNCEQPGFILSFTVSIVMVDVRGYMFNIQKSRQFTKEEYENLIKALKQAGERLSKLIKDSKKVEIEVVI